MRFAEAVVGPTKIAHSGSRTGPRTWLLPVNVRAAAVFRFHDRHPLDGRSSATTSDASERFLLCLPMGVSMLPLLERTETSVCRRFMGSYRASNK